MGEPPSGWIPFPTEYLQLVEGRREGRKVRQRVVATLGRLDELQGSGQLDRLAASFARHDPPAVGTRREVGPLLLVRHYLDRLGLRAIVDRTIPQRGRAQLTHGEVVCAMVANRLASPAPLYDVAAWATQAAMAEVFDIPGSLLNDDRLGRTLDTLAPVAEHVRGAATLAAVERCGADAARLHVDLTTLRFAGAYPGSGIVAKGWGPDRRVARQVRVLEATSPDGIPLYVRPHPGAAAELTLIGEALERLAELLPPGLLVCADSALGHPRSLCLAHRAGVSFIVSLREGSGFRRRFLEEVGHEGLHPLRYLSRRDRGKPPEARTRYRGALRHWEVTDPETQETYRFRVAYVWSSEEARSVAEGRERALAKAEERLERVRRGLGGPHYRTRQQVEAAVARILPPVEGLLHVEVGGEDGRPTLSFRRNEGAIAAAGAADGVYALATNLPGRTSATRVLRTYKDQTSWSSATGTSKDPSRSAPCFLHNDARIDALISIVGLALLVFGLTQADLRRALGPEETLPGLLPEGRAARPTGRSILAAFQGLGLTYTTEGIVLDRLTVTQRQILDALGVPLPWPERGR